MVKLPLPVQNLVDFVVHIVRQLWYSDLRRGAAALTFTSLFAIVPLMTVTFTLFSAIPAFDKVGAKVEDLVFRYFVPTAGTDVQHYLVDFSHQAQKLTVVGFVFLAVTAYLMLRSIETAFNNIWNTRGHRKGLSGFLLYWAVLSLGPLLLGIGFMASTYLLSLNILVDNGTAWGMGSQLLNKLPLLTETLTFTLLYYAVPNCRVPLPHALFGGLLIALVFESAKAGFGLFVGHTSHRFIYGAFAAVPLFLTWIYVSWMLLLAGAVFVHGLSSYGDSRNEQPGLLVALAMLALFHEQHRIGRALDEKTLLERRWRPDGRPIARESWERVRNQLIDMHLITATEDHAYVLSHDLGTVKLSALARAFPDQGLDAQVAGNTAPPWLRKTLQLLQDDSKRRQAAFDIPLLQLYGKSA